MRIGVGVQASAFARTGGDAPAQGNLTALAIDSIKPGKVHQRTDGESYADIPMTGSYTGTPGTIQVGLFDTSDDSQVGSWQTVTAGDGFWSGLIRVPASTRGYYRKVRHVGQTSLTYTDNNVLYAGDNFAIYGQSNALGMRGAGGGQPAIEGARLYEGETDSWTDITNQRGVYELTKQVMARTGVACGVLVGGRGGTPLNALDEGSPTFTEFADWVTSMAADIRGVLMIQGESDAGLGTEPNDYLDLLGHVHASLANLVGRTIHNFPMVIAGLGTYTANYTEPEFNLMNHALRRAENYLPGSVHFGFSRQLAPLKDTIHHDPEGYAAIGQYAGEMLAHLLGASAARPSFRIVGANRLSSTQTSVLLEHGQGTDFTPASGITGFEISQDAGASWTPATGSRTDASTVTLTHAAIDAVRERWVRYQYGGQSVGASPISDNSILTIPLWPEAGFGEVAAPGVSPLPIPRFLGSRSSVGPLAQASQEEHTSLPFTMLDGLACTEEMLAIVTISMQGEGAIFDDVLPGIAFTLDAGEASDVIIQQTTTGATQTVGAHIATAILPVGTRSFTVTKRTPGKALGAPRMAAFVVPTSRLNAVSPVDKGFADVDQAIDVPLTLTTTTDAFIVSGFVTRERTAPLSVSADNNLPMHLWADREDGGERHGAALGAFASAGATTVTGSCGNADDMAIAGVVLR